MMPVEANNFVKNSNLDDVSLVESEIAVSRARDADQTFGVSLPFVYVAARTTSHPRLAQMWLDHLVALPDTKVSRQV